MNAAVIGGGKYQGQQRPGEESAGCDPPHDSVEHVALVTGLKHYLGPFEAYGKGVLPATPFREEQGRLDVENFFYAQEGYSITVASGMSEGMEFRDYRRGDLDAMVELDEECFAPPFRFSHRAMQRFAEAGNAWVHVAEDDGGLAGFCIVHRESAGVAEMGYVVTIDVASPHRGRGIGERMLSEGEAWVHSWLGAGVMLHVFVKNERAVRFYERMGYRRVGMQRGFYGPGLDAAMYWKDLGS